MARLLHLHEDDTRAGLHPLQGSRSADPSFLRAFPQAPIREGWFSSCVHTWSATNEKIGDIPGPSRSVRGKLRASSASRRPITARPFLLRLLRVLTSPSLS